MKFLVLGLWTVGASAQFIGFPGPAVPFNVNTGSAPTYVSASAATCFGTTSCNVTAAANVTNGNTLVVYGTSNATTTWNLPTKNSGTATVGTFTAVPGTCRTADPANCAWTASITATGSLVISISTTTATGFVGGMYEVSGTTGIDTESSYNATTSCTSCSGSTLTSSMKSLVVTHISTLAGLTLSAPSPFSFDINTNPNGTTIAWGHFTQTSAGAYSPTWTSNIAASQANISIAFH